MFEKVCPHCGAKIYSVIEPRFCPKCKKKWSTHKPIGILISSLPEPKIKMEVTQMVKPKGHKKGCNCPFCRPRKAKAKGKGKAAKKTTGAVEQHKAYSYTNKKGKRVTVAAHTERR